MEDNEIYFTRGNFQFTNGNEGSIAAVLAHEMGHISAGHIKKKRNCEKYSAL